MNDLMEGFCDEHLVCGKNIADSKEEIKEMKKEIDALWRTSDNTKERVMKLEFTIEQLNKTVESVSINVKDVKFEGRKNQEENEKRLTELGNKNEEKFRQILDKIDENKNDKSNKWFNVFLKFSEVIIALTLGTAAILQYMK